jgi:hypothetical protein
MTATATAEHRIDNDSVPRIRFWVKPPTQEARIRLLE